MRRTTTNPANNSRIVIQKLQIGSTKGESIQKTSKKLTVQKHKTVARDPHKAVASDCKTSRRSVGVVLKSNGPTPTPKARRTILPCISQKNSRRNDSVGKKDGAKGSLAPEKPFEIGLSCRLEKEQTKMRQNVCQRTSFCSINGLLTAQDHSSEVVGKIKLLMKVYKPVSNSTDNFVPEILKAKRLESNPRCRLPVLKEIQKHSPESGRFPKRKHRIAPLENLEQLGAQRPLKVIPEKPFEIPLENTSSNLGTISTIDPVQKSLTSEQTDHAKSCERKSGKINENQSIVHSKLQRHQSETFLPRRKLNYIESETFGSDHQFPRSLRNTPKVRHVKISKSTKENKRLLTDHEVEDKQVSILRADTNPREIEAPSSTVINDSHLERECPSPSREYFFEQPNKLAPLTKSSLSSTKSLPLNLNVAEPFTKGNPSLLTSGILSLGLFWLPVSGQFISGHNLTADDKYRQETLGNFCCCLDTFLYA